MILPVPVRRRHVFYLSGFDPLGPAHYHRLYAEQAALQAAVGGYRLEVGPRRNAGPDAAAWELAWQGAPDLPTVASTFTFLRWDDIVRSHWPRHRLAVIGCTLTSTASLLRSGVLWQILKTSWPAFVALAMPSAVLAVLGAWALLSAILATWLAGHVGLVIAALAAGVAAATAFAVEQWAQARVQSAWLMRSTRFILRQAAGQAGGLEARLDGFAGDVAAAMAAAAPGDEVLVVGHSSGAILAVSVVARALRLVGRAPEAVRTRLSLLTLGECIPMLSYQPEAHGFRAELAALATAASLDWVDVTAPPDGCCFALIDPTAIARDRSGEPALEWRPPKRVSPRFAELFSPATYPALRRDRLRCHFQYLRAGERAGFYDYFALTAGPRRLADAFSAQPSVTGFRRFQCFGGPRGMR